MYLKVDEFQTYILELWKNEEEIKRVLSSTQHGDEELFIDGFKFGLIWAGLCSAGDVKHYYWLEGK